MAIKRVGKQTMVLTNTPAIIGNACVVGTKEGDGPLGDHFDYIESDPMFGEKTWEQAESKMIRHAFSLALAKAGLEEKDVHALFSGDLLNQCISTAFAFRDTGIPYFGLYGACSTMAESLSLAALAVDGGYAANAAAVTSSHFCSAERQFRSPLEYGGQRTPTAQWTVTGSGAIILAENGPGPYVTHVTPGRIVDAGITDTNNMGAAMAPAAYDTIRHHLDDMQMQPKDYDLILTGDLGSVGGEILTELFRADGLEIGLCYNDCGMMIYSSELQDVHAGGSGCGCSASVLTGYILNNMRLGQWNKILFAATGALMSPTSSQQGLSIPSVCCAVTISTRQAKAHA